MKHGRKYSALNNKRKTIPQVGEKYNILKLVIKDYSGFRVACNVPINKIIFSKGFAKPNFHFENRHSNLCIVECKTDEIVIPDNLIGSKIYLKRGDTTIYGRISKATPLCKGTSGDQVPAPAIKQ